MMKNLHIQFIFASHKSEYVEYDNYLSKVEYANDESIASGWKILLDSVMQTAILVSCWLPQKINVFQSNVCRKFDKWYVVGDRK